MPLQNFTHLPGPVLTNQPLNRFFTYLIHAQNAAISSVGDCSSEDDVKELAGNESIWEQFVEIVKFSGPAAGLWLCGPLMSLMDTLNSLRWGRGRCCVII